MAACSHTTDCALFPMISVNSALKVWRTFYCEGKWTECARYKLSLVGKPVPSNLLPNGKSLDLGIGSPLPAAKPPPAAKPIEDSIDITAGTSADIELGGVGDDTATVDLGMPLEARSPPPAHDATNVSSATMSYYLRMQIQPGTGVMTEIIRSLGQSQVRIDAVTEKKGVGNAPSYLIVLTDQVNKPTLDAAVTALEGLNCVSGNVKRVALEQMAGGHLA